MKSQYLRTFIGLPVHPGKEMLEARRELMTALEGERISWTDPARYHVTLRFIGDTEESMVRGIGKALHSGLNIDQQVIMEFTGLASFGPRKKPRVIWVGFEHSEFFLLLKSEVDRILEPFGFMAEKPPFTAHLTLGRVRRLQNLDHYYKTVEEMNPKFKGAVRFEKLVFFRSVLGPGGPSYHVLDEIIFRKGINPS
jgi:RNA 2',3'-cyclic 3'-phosphodiesterase